MTASLNAEWLKLITTRAFYGLAIGAALLSAFITFGLTASGPPPWHLTANRFDETAVVNGISVGLFALIVGLRIATEEFRYGTIVHTAVSDPARTRTMVAKAAVGGVAGALLSAVSALVIAGTAVALTQLSGGSLDGSGVTASLLGLTTAGALWGLLGVGVGVLLRQPVAATVTALLWVLVAENVADLFLGPVTRYLPSHAGQELIRGASDPSTALAAVGVLAAWAATLGVAGWTALRRRDLA